MRTEFDFINDIKLRYGLNRVGDDCSILPKDESTDLLLTADLLVEHVDFRLEWSSPEQIGYKALAVSLSDIAAMGGTPTSAMLSIAVVENLWKGDFLDRFYSGWHELAKEYDVELVGGDLSRTDGPLTIDSTVLGIVPTGRAIRRSGARVGDGIFVTGALGASAGGLAVLLSKRDPASAAAKSIVQDHLQPYPKLPVGNYLMSRGLATSMLDISDGLSSDLHHICDASGVGAEICAERVPVASPLVEVFGPEEAFEMALNGGEDLQLLFTSSESTFEMEQITRIGTITDTAELIEVIADGRRIGLAPRGYRHFGSDTRP